MKRLAGVALVSAVVIVYHSALSASFFDDDFQWLVASWSFRPAQLVAFGSLSHFYRPVIDIYFAVMTPLTGGSPVLFHAASIALHAANVLVVFALASRIYGPAKAGLYGFVAALFFAVQPSDIDAIAWVGALAEAIGALFGCLSLLWFLRWREEGHVRFRTLSLGAFALALLTHESSVMFLPVLFLANYLSLWRVQKDPPSTSHSGANSTGSGADLSGPRAFMPYIVLTVVYLAIDLWINSRNYLVAEGHYTIGLHIFTNALDYLDALYVGRGDRLSYAVIAVGVAALLIRGNARVRFATCWMLLALAPFLLFNWANTSRYLYQPAIGFSMLLAEGMMQLRRRPALLTAVAVAIAIRFALFANGNVSDFAMRTQVYPDYLARFREIHRDIPSNTVIAADTRLVTTLPYQFVNAAVQWEYRDPTIRLAPY